jgi:hypothetical protein
MKRNCTVILALLLAGSATAADVYKTTDPKGQPVYTDRPDSLPAQKMNVPDRSTDPAEVAKRYDEQMARYQAQGSAEDEAAKKAAEARQAAEMTAEDQAKRCVEARQKYESLMYARRIYEPGEKEGERRYLDSEEIDAARENARQTMEELCAGQ